MEENKLMNKKYRSFIPLAAHFDEEFKILMEELFRFIRSHGIDKVGIEMAKSHSLDFFSAVHEGWKLAQTKIIENVDARLKKIISLEKDKKEHHRLKDKKSKDECINKINKSKLEIKVLRRFIDSIVWTICEDEHSTIRRLPLNDNTDNLSSKNINDTLPAINKFNEDPLTIAIMSDLTSFVQTGDVIARSYGEGISLIELKSGQKNKEFCEAANFSINSGCKIFDENFLNGRSVTDIAHYNRTKKQIIHLNEVSKIINTGEGFDHYSKKTVRIHDNNYIPKFFNESIVNSWRKICLGKNWDIHVIDSCLFIGVYRDYKLGFVAFNAWKDSLPFNGVVFNITSSFILKYTKPIINLNLPDELIIEILTGKITIVLCIDFDMFYDFANKTYPKLLSKKVLDKKTVLSGDVFSCNGNGLVSMSDGNENFVGTGFISRMIFDLQRPKNIIDWIYKGSDLRKKDNKEKNKVNPHVRKSNKIRKSQRESRRKNRS